MIGRIFKSLVICVVLGCAAYFAYTKYWESQEQTLEQTAMNRSGRVEKADIIQKVSVAGHVYSARMTEVRAPFEGYVQKVFVHIGDKVQKGDPLISIVETLNLVGQDVYPVRAPFAGTVTQVIATAGQNVSKERDSNTSGVLLRVDDLTKMFVNADVPELDYVHIQIGYQALVKAPAILNRPYHATVVERALAPNTQNGYSRDKVEYSIKLEVTDHDKQLRPGMSVISDIVVAERKDVLSLLLDFVERDNEDCYVTKMNGEKVKIKVGIQDDMRVEILEGLKEGDLIKQIDFLNTSSSPGN